MKVYFHDYDRAIKAEKMLRETLEDISHSDNPATTNGYFGWVKDKIEEAIAQLREYIDSDNEKPEDGADVYGGFVKRFDFFDEEQLCQIRDEFAGIIEQTDNANDELDIINVCQRLLDDPEYKDYEQWKRNTSNVWTEITED